MNVPALPELAAQATAILVAAAPFLRKAAEGAASAAGKASWGGAAKLWESVRGWFLSEKNDGATQTMELFLKDPERFESVLAQFIGEALAAHPEWADEVRSLLAESRLQEVIVGREAEVNRIRQSMRVVAGQQRVEVKDKGKITGTVTQDMELE